MRWGEIETLMKGGFEAVVDVGARNKYFIRKEEKMYFPISSFQFDRLLEGGYIDSDYRIDREGLLGGEMLIYRGR